MKPSLGERRCVRLPFLGIDRAGAVVRIPAGSVVTVTAVMAVPAEVVQVRWNDRLIQLHPLDLTERTEVVSERGKSE